MLHTSWNGEGVKHLELSYTTSGDVKQYDHL